MSSIDEPDEPGAALAVDIDMTEAAADEQVGSAAAAAAEVDAGGDENGEAAASEDVREPTPVPTRTPFASYLSSRVVTLVVGGGEGEETKETMELTAHQDLLTKSPYFAKLCADLGDDRTITLPDQNLDAVGCFLEYLYTGDYFPRKLAGHAHALEEDPTVPAVDETGAQLLKHARVYTLAEVLGMAELQTFASSKIHCVQSTAQGEIAYARYVYACTKADDTTVRHPVAKFWATRSHTLRAEAEAEFQALCLEHPQFAYDVLTRVLDEKLRRERDDKKYTSVSLSSPQPGGGSGRKRARNSSSVQ
ncbi:uncharacterized protein SPSK_07732 [Sporothrix schenckii 1099-18]|uniref:BTB domain-containing protein n=1 Tax=Sporothrix schenckii 1099-18 TaxID=1397361 RepID=A0A0F2MGA8_SPOSC|nr:uncharacterized protein SPSK_07732 [Sporothrix schenckii 1099-18]KJR88094.1 hypothetical protein SPSK_07732 [Sporothrix schenckii 1099-18]